MFTLLRQQEYQEISELILNGEILDLGGNIKSGYQDLIRGQHKFTAVNIDPKTNSELVFDIEKKFPLPDESFDNVLCLNVLEHIFNYKNVLDESFRVLKKGGQIIIATPFLHYIHASPYDYFRYTDSALKKILESSGFEVEQIKPLGGQIFSVQQNFFNLIFPSFLVKGLQVLAKVVDRILSVTPRYRELNKITPLGYFTIARK